MSHPGKHSTFFVYLSNDDDDSDNSNSCSEAKRKPKKMPKGQRTYTARQQQQQHQQLPPSTFHFHPIFDEATNKKKLEKEKHEKPSIQIIVFSCSHQYYHRHCECKASCSEESTEKRDNATQRQNNAHGMWALHELIHARPLCKGNAKTTLTHRRKKQGHFPNFGPVKEAAPKKTHY